MSRPINEVKETYTGDGSLDEYTFDFKITELTQLLIVVVNNLGVEVQRVRGDDTVYLDSVEFDSVEGGGTVYLKANLTTDYEIILLLAPDEPNQPFEFSNKSSFSLKRFEASLDHLSGQIQRLAYLAKQSIRVHDIDDEDAIDLQLPPYLADNAGKMLIVNATGDGFDYSTTTEADLITAINNAQTTANTALALAQAVQAAFNAEMAATTRYIVGSESVNGSWRWRQSGTSLFRETRKAGLWLPVEEFAQP